MRPSVRLERPERSNGWRAIVTAAFTGEWAHQTVEAYLRDVILPHVRAELAFVAAWDAVDRVQITPRGAVFRVRSGAWDLAVKIVGPKHRGRQTAPNEFAALQRARALDPQQRFVRVPRPRVVNEEMATFVTDWIDAPTLQKVLAAGTEPDRRTATAAATEWLVQFHSLKTPSYHCFVADELVHQFASVVDFHAPRIGTDERDRIAPLVARFTEACAALDGLAVPFVQRHGDASAGNFLITRDGAVAIDLTDEFFDDPVCDFVHILLDAELYDPPPARMRSAQWGLREDHIEQVRRGLVGPKHADDRLRVRLLREALHRLLVVLAGPPTGRFGERALVAGRLFDLLDAIARQPRRGWRHRLLPR